MYSRVWYARYGAEASCELEDVVQEKEFLNFIVAHGNKLHAVDEAKERLRELAE